MATFDANATSQVVCSLCSEAESKSVKVGVVDGDEVHLSLTFTLLLTVTMISHNRNQVFLFLLNSNYKLTLLWEDNEEIRTFVFSVNEHQGFLWL